jgi:hypothetical protein
MQNIESELTSYLQNSRESIQQILFVPQGTHPVWEDNLEIFQLANQQILQPLGVYPNEHIFAFIGMHAKTGITGKRDSIGFLITNFRVLTQTDFSVIRNGQNAQSTLFTQTQIPDDLATKIWNDFTIKNSMSIAQEQLLAMQTALHNIIGLVLWQLQGLNLLPKEIQKSTDIQERIKDLSLQNVLKTYLQEEKILKKFAEKHTISKIMFGIVDKPFFSSAYGLVITKTGITIRDAMEDSVTSTWEEIRKTPAIIGNKNDIILAGQKKHVLPQYQSPSVQSVIILINELANGEVSW